MTEDLVVKVFDLILEHDHYKTEKNTINCAVERKVKMRLAPRQTDKRKGQSQCMPKMQKCMVYFRTKTIPSLPFDSVNRMKRTTQNQKHWYTQFDVHGYVFTSQ